jgi:hypothetical protein
MKGFFCRGPTLLASTLPKTLQGSPGPDQPRHAMITSTESLEPKNLTLAFLLPNNNIVHLSNAFIPIGLNKLY